MAKLRVVHRCRECGAVESKWSGRCGGCGAWNSLVEELAEASGGPRGGLAGLTPGSPPTPIGDVELGAAHPVATRLGELDRVLGGGLVPGSVTLLGGEPGIGKSTLLLQLLAAQRSRALYVCAEESAEQVRLRAERLGAVREGLWVHAANDLGAILSAITEVAAELVVVDSIQTIADAELPSAPGSVVQVRECAHRLVQEAKRRGITVLLVGHVTKDGALAGPRLLEHVVDTVLSFEGERHHLLRLLHAVKHRFGPTNELGVFEMTDHGLAGVADPSGLFLADRRPGVPGSVVVPTLEGQRPLLVELQALVTDSALAQPRRSAQGFDQGRLSLLLAVLERRAGLSAARADVFTSVVGGVRLNDPGADVAICLATASAMLDVPLAEGLVACGEIGLGGELRQPAHLARRLKEAARLGFTRAIVPRSAPAVDGIRVEHAATLHEALSRAGLLPSGTARARPPRVGDEPLSSFHPARRAEPAPHAPAAGRRVVALRDRARANRS